MPCSRTTDPEQLWALWGADPIPVLALYTYDGELTEDLNRAYRFVAGPVRGGGHLSGLVSEHPELRKH